MDEQTTAATPEAPPAQTTGATPEPPPETTAPPAAPPELAADVPMTSEGLPAYQKVRPEQVYIAGLPRTIGRADELEPGELDQVRAALQKFLDTARPATYDSQKSYRVVNGRRRLHYERTDRDATLEDIAGATLHQTTMSGRALGPTGIYVSFSLKTGDNFEISLDGAPLHTCCFCGGHQGPVKLNRMRGVEYHEPCKHAAEVEVAREQASPADKVFGKARFKG